MTRIALPWLALLASTFLSGCYQSYPCPGGESTYDATVEVVSEPDVDTFDPLPEYSWDAWEESDAWDVDLFEFDGYSPPECSLFTVDVEWDVGIEDPYTSATFFEASDEPMLSVVSLYEATDCEHHSRCPVTLHVARTYRPVILALSSYEPIEWVIDRDEGARIEKIYVMGYYDSIVSGASDVPVEDLGEYSYVGHCWPACSGHRTRDEVLGLAARVGVPLGSFYGAYNTAELKLWHVCREECREDVVCTGRECGINECGYECGTCPAGHRCDDHRCVSCTPDCSGRTCGSDGCDGSCGACPEDFVCVEGVCIEAPYYSGCEEVTTESHYCITLIDDGPAILGLDTGLVCPIGKRGGPLSGHLPEAHSIALLDGYIHVCMDGSIGSLGVHGLLRVSLLTGAWEIAPVLCYALARYEAGLLVQPDMSFGPDGIVYYPSFEHVRSETGTPLPEEPTASRMTVNGDALYTAWHSTDTVESYSLPSGAWTGDISLEGYDTWIMGMAVTDDGLLVCNAAWPEGRLAIFDASTGAHIRDVIPVGATGPGLSGLICTTNP